MPGSHGGTALKLPFEVCTTMWGLVQVPATQLHIHFPANEHLGRQEVMAHELESSIWETQMELQAPSWLQSGLVSCL